jgi:glycine oxidase
MPQPMFDVIVIGAGVIGSSIALALARLGVSVGLLDRGAPGGEASSAAAGVLGMQVEMVSDGPFAHLAAKSLELYPRWVAELTEQTGIDVGYRRTGGLFVALTEDALHAFTRSIAWQAPLGLTSEVLDSAAARALEPALSPDIAGAVRFPMDARSDPPTLTKATRIAAEQAGVEVRAGAQVRRVVVEGGRAAGVVLEDGSVLRAPKVVVAAGSWSALIEGTSLPEGSVRPTRGQIVELITGRLPVQRVLYGPGCYFSPRDEGRILVGSTMERVGFRPGVTAGAVQALLAAAIRLVPSLADVGVGRMWSGFRPEPLGELPLLGPTSIEGLFLATGHFRNGVTLSPITAAVLAAAVTGAPSPVDLAPFSAARFELRAT